MAHRFFSSRDPRCPSASSTIPLRSRPAYRMLPSALSENDQRQQTSPTPPLELRKSIGSFRASRQFPVSISCPHLPLFTRAPSVPPTLSATIAVGSTTPTRELSFTLNAPGSVAVASESPTTSTPVSRRRLSMSGFPWDDRATSGKQSPAAELAGNIARRSLPATPAIATQSKTTPPSPFERRSSPKSTLRLELPPQRIHGGLGAHTELARKDQSEGEGCGSHKFVGQPLLRLAYPTTPDIGLNSSPVMYEVGKGGEGLSTCGEIRGGRAMTAGGAVAAAQHVLLAAGSHMGGGGLALLTPPDDNGIIDWRHDLLRPNEGLNKNTTGLGGADGSPESSCVNTNHAEMNANSNNSADRTNSSSAAQHLTIAVSGSGTQTPKEEDKDRSEQTVEYPTDEGWVEGAMDVLVGSTFPISTATEAVRILSYTLPCPLPDAPGTDSVTRANPVNPDRLPLSAASAPSVAAAAGHQLSPTIAARCAADNDVYTSGLSESGTTTALHSLTSAIQRRYLNEGSKRVYIHVSHAIDPQIPLSRLPSTPPLTGGGASAGGFGSPRFEGGDGGYFAPTVFNSIVVAPCSMTSTPTGGAHQPPNLPPMSSPNPILPPDSLHLTLVERYIPPSSAEEHFAMFSPKTSLLRDRMYELSPNGGSLLFIYPTKNGARSFDQDYLGRQLDPLLRKLMVLYALPQDLLWNIRNMAASSKMYEFAELHSTLDDFCTAMSNGTHGLPKTFTKVVYSARVQVNLNEFSWREWWTTQEQTRIREIVKSHLATQSSKSDSAKTKRKETNVAVKSGFWQGYGVPGDLAREVLDGVRAPSIRPSSRGMGEAVLASSMSGSGAGVSATAGVGKASVELPDYGPPGGIEVGVFILRRGCL